MRNRLRFDSLSKGVDPKIGCTNLSPFAEINQLFNPKLAYIPPSNKLQNFPKMMIVPNMIPKILTDDGLTLT